MSVLQYEGVVRNADSFLDIAVCAVCNTPCFTPECYERHPASRWLGEPVGCKACLKIATQTHNIIPVYARFPFGMCAK